MKESFVLYASQYEAIADLTQAQKGELFESLFHYVMSDEVPAFSCPEIKMAFNFMRLQIDRDTKRYESIVAKRRAAGRLGGRPQKAKGEDASPEKQEKANKANAFFAKHNDNVNDNVSNTNIVGDTDYSKKTKTKREELLKNEEKWFLDVLHWFNDMITYTGSSVRPVKVINDKRREALRAIRKQYNGDQIRTALGNALHSPYANGKTKQRKTPADFDWIIRFDNFTRAFEGSL